MADALASKMTISSPSTPPPAPVVVVDEDDLEVEVKPGTTCKRTGCGKKFVSQEKSRLGDEDDATCIHHPSPVNCSIMVIVICVLLTGSHSRYSVKEAR